MRNHQSLGRPEVSELEDLIEPDYLLDAVQILDDLPADDLAEDFDWNGFNIEMTTSAITSMRT